MDTNRSIDRGSLVNYLNFISFQDKEIVSVFMHKKYGQLFTVKVKPDPCDGRELHCTWEKSFPDELHSAEYVFDHLQFEDGPGTITIPSDSFTLNNDGIILTLPDEGFELVSRKIHRRRCENIRVQMIQNGNFFKGTLVRFTPESFRVNMEVISRHDISRINKEAPVSLVFLKEGKIIFSADCHIIRSEQENGAFVFIFKPAKNRIQRFKHKEFRNHRVTLVPAPSLVFKHPLSNEIINLPVSDLSGTGFSVEEYLDKSVLVPGLIISDADLIVSTDIGITCKIQILYREVSVETKYDTLLKVGICLLDMKPEDHVRYLSLVSQARNKHIYLDQDLDVDAFWQFFFKTGFIYPEKYSSMYENKNKIKEMYTKMYTKTPEIARYVTYQENGMIHGHLSILRVYDNTWMIHHHASSASSHQYAGLSVLDHISDYVYSAYQLPSIHLDYVMCYYRPENKFPAKIFGGTRKSINDLHGCSEDEFAFLSITYDKDLVYDELAVPVIEESSEQDLLQLKEFYRRISGGIMLDAMDILPGSSQNEDIVRVYRKEKLKREIKLLSLKQDNILLAVFFIDITETGLNLSELTNSVKLFVLEPDLFSPEMLKISLNEIAGKYYDGKSHVLIFPSSYAVERNVDYKKKYVFWVIDASYSDPYFKYVNKFFRLAGDK